MEIMENQSWWFFRLNQSHVFHFGLLFLLFVKAVVNQWKKETDEVSKICTNIESTVIRMNENFGIRLKKRDVLGGRSCPPVFGCGPFCYYDYYDCFVFDSSLWTHASRACVSNVAVKGEEEKKNNRPARANPSIIETRRGRHSPHGASVSLRGRNQRLLKPHDRRDGRLDSAVNRTRPFLPPTLLRPTKFRRTRWNSPEECPRKHEATRYIRPN